MLKMKGVIHSRQQCYDCIVSGNETESPETSENNSANEETEDGFTIEQPSCNSRTQYENAVLKAYGIVPLATQEGNNFGLSKKGKKGQKSGENTCNLMTGKAQNLLAIERPSGQPGPRRTQYEQTVLKAYGIVLTE